MISKIVAFKSSDGQTFDTLEKVQQHEIELILNTALPDNVKVSGNPTVHIELAAKTIIKHAEKVIDILTTKGGSRPAARKANGAVRKKRGQAPAAPTPLDKPQ